MVDVKVSEIKAVSKAALVAHGAADWVAAEVARATARSEQVGNVICGLYYLESYCLALDSGRVKGGAEPDVMRPRPGVVLADAREGFAQPAFMRGLPLALEAAAEQGVASFGVANSHTCTSLGYFTETIAKAGFVAMGFTCASPVVAPPGSAGRVIGTNPIAFSVPDGAGGLAIHFDAATSNVALGAITRAKAAGEAIPEGWAVDADGASTTDPAAALGGALTSLGGAKGFGFGLMAEVLASGMTGSVNSLDVAGLKLPDGPPHRLGQYYLILDPGVSPAFGDRVGRVSAAVEVQPGARMPGTRRGAARSVEVPEDVWAAALALAGR